MVQDYRSGWLEETAETKDIKRLFKKHQGDEKLTLGLAEADSPRQWVNSEEVLKGSGTRGSSLLKAWAFKLGCWDRGK